MLPVKQVLFFSVIAIFLAGCTSFSEPAISTYDADHGPHPLDGILPNGIMETYN